MAWAPDAGGHLTAEPGGRLAQSLWVHSAVAGLGLSCGWRQAVPLRAVGTPCWEDMLLECPQTQALCPQQVPVIAL